MKKYNVYTTNENYRSEQTYYIYLLIITDSADDINIEDVDLNQHCWYTCIWTDKYSSIEQIIGKCKRYSSINQSFHKEFRFACKKMIYWWISIIDWNHHFHYAEHSKSYNCINEDEFIERCMMFACNDNAIGPNKWPCHHSQSHQT